MKCIKQKNKALPINNFDIKLSNSDELQKRHGELFPNSIRALIVGPSNCGKTNAMLSMLLHRNGLKFENVYLYSKSLYQSKYKYLERIIRSIRGMGFYTFSNNDDVIPPDQARNNSVFIFDDVACDKQNNIRDYFSMGRHKNIDSFYLCQTYTRIPKHLIRDNANFLLVFKQDDLNLKHIFNDHIYGDMTFDAFKQICVECWKDQYGFLCIDKDNDLDQGRYRKGFDHFFMKI